MNKQCEVCKLPTNSVIWCKATNCPCTRQRTPDDATAKALEYEHNQSHHVSFVEVAR